MCQQVKGPVFLSLLTFMGMTTFQILLPCYLGSELTAASEELAMTAFHVNWADEPENFKTSLKIFLENSKKPVKVAVMKVFHVSLANFLFVVNSAYSIYAVLKIFKD
jgi:hypothetical protein